MYGASSADGETSDASVRQRRRRTLVARRETSTHRYPFPQLTDRERAVLELIAQGRSNHEIARHVVLSTKTVRNHVSNVFT